METLRFAKVRDVKSPERGTPKSAGIDFFVPYDFFPQIIEPGQDILIPSGIKVSIPEGFMLIGEEKSGVSTSKRAVMMAGRVPKEDAFRSATVVGAKIIDEDFQGEMHIHIINCGRALIRIEPGMKIAQFILVPVSYCALQEVAANDLYSETTQRGEGGFGSTN